MSKTPETDSIPRRGPFHHYIVDDVLAKCRELEIARDTARAEVERLRGALERAETSMTRYCNGLHANGSDDMALEVVRKALTAAPVATDDGSCEDRAILDWLENASAVNRRSAVGVQRNGVEADVEWWEVSNGEVVGTGDTLREAVRTALLPPPPAQEGGGK